MKFHLDHSPAPSPDQLHHGHHIALIGSCFAENIGQYLQEHRFHTLLNPYGILFNPLSMAICLENILENKINTKYFVQRDQTYFSLLHHSSVHANTAEALTENIKSIHQQSREFLEKADHLILTLGSAHSYFHKELGTTVANCHKLPGTAFEKRLASVHEISTALTKVLQSLKALNPNLRITLTVSPVKYLKDGLEANALSKATLLLAAHELKNKFQLNYFPAYELLNDDLRDYRFYKEDLAHPNAQAVHYIWEKFSKTYFSEATQQLNEKIARLHRALAHRPLHHNQEEENKFREHLRGLEAELEKELNAVTRQHHEQDLK